MHVVSRSVALAAIAVSVLMAGMAEARQAPVMNAASVAGANVTFTWSAAAGATDYVLQAGVVPGVYLGALSAGNVTTYAAVAPAVGTFYARVVAVTAAGPLVSNEIAVTVTTLAAVPAAPTNLVVARNGTSIVATWSPGAGGAPLGYRLKAGFNPGGTEAALNLGTNIFAYGPLPAGTLYFRVSAFNAGGEGPDSAEFTLNMPAGGACDTPPAPVLTKSVFGGFINVSWTPVPGAAGYVLTGYQGGANLGSVPVGAGFTRFSNVLPEGVFRLDVAAVFACGAQGPAASVDIVVDQTSLKMQPRVDDPAPGSALPSPGYVLGVVREMAAAYPGDLRNSCHEFGGNNRWLFRLVAKLRERDKRWGLNWKRANIGDMSQDVIAYNWGDEGDEGTFKVRAWDVIGGHCGPNPSGQATEITSPNPPAVTFGARWTLQPFIQAGFVP